MRTMVGGGQGTRVRRRAGTQESLEKQFRQLQLVETSEPIPVLRRKTARSRGKNVVVMVWTTTRDGRRKLVPRS